jgi:PAS domain S-box-containing protein
VISFSAHDLLARVGRRLKAALTHAEDVQTLHELSLRLIGVTQLQPLLEEILDATIALQDADLGTVQTYNPQTRLLELVAQRGFDPEFVACINTVDERSPTSCGRALRLRRRVVIEDVLADETCAPFRDAAVAAGFRGQQSTPLFSRNGELLGMISTHFRGPHRPRERELRLTDLYARQAAEMMERKRADKRLGESERRFRLLAESLPHHVWSFRTDGSFGYWNHRLVEYTGLGDEARRGGGWEALHPDDVERVRDAWNAASAQGLDYEVEQRLRGRDGHYRRFVSRGVAVKDEAGRPIEWFGTDTDVEERRQTEEALQKAQSELSHIVRLTTMGELAASIAHEVNQPLAAIVANGNACQHWLAEDPPNLAEARAAIQRTVRDANRAGDVVSRIRGFLRQEESRTVLDINDVIREAVELIRGEVQRQRVFLHVELAAGLPPVLADRTQLQQVALNLMINALESMAAVTEPAGTLTVRTGLGGNATVFVSVRDAGVGLDPAIREKIFDAFYTTKPQGLGMGLAISRSIVEAHGGKLWSAANADRGETFHFTMPFAEVGVA